MRRCNLLVVVPANLEVDCFGLVAVYLTSNFLVPSLAMTIPGEATKQVIARSEKDLVIIQSLDGVVRKPKKKWHLRRS